MLPAAPPVRTPEAVRTAARRRFLFAAVLMALGPVLLAVAQVSLLALSPVGGVTGLLLGALLQVLGLATAATGALLFTHAFPLSESGISARFAFLAALFVVLPVAAAGTAAYIFLALPDSPPVSVSALVLIPALPFFWGAVSAFAAIGFVYAARELASERMAVLAALGAGGIIAITLSAGAGAVMDPVGALRSVRLATDLAIVAIGFGVIAAAFRWDAYAVRMRRIP